MNCRNANTLLHDYLDDDIDEFSSNKLFSHIKTCGMCRQHFNQLKETEVILRSLSHNITTPEYIQKVMEKLTHNKTRKSKMNRWFRNHPAFVAASIFLMFFSISLFSYVIPGNELKIVANDHNSLIIEKNAVIVPEGEEIEGDLIVQNGNLEIMGKVKGNVTVIDGQLLMANTSKVDGNTKQIDQLFEWLWYQIEKYSFN